jgi:uncharacterized repeat protein (TIGR03806 family)
MPKKTIAVLIIMGLVTFMLCCSPDKSSVTPSAPDDGISLDLSKVPYPRLSDYGFFAVPLKDQQTVAGVLPYQPASTLFTDYALKKRFVWMPSGKKAKYVSDGKVLDFPIGSVLIKTFYYDHVQPEQKTEIIETRLMVRKADGWIFAEYVWKPDQSDALLDMKGSYRDISWKNEAGTLFNAHYRIPSEVECFTCHKFNEQPIPIGPKPQNLDNNYSYAEGSSNQLQKWIDAGYLESTGLPPHINATVDYRDSTQPLDLRLRSYLDINCGHCHQEGSHCDYRPIRLAFSETGDLQNIGVCVVPDENIGEQLKYIIMPQHPEHSEMYYRLSSTDAGVRMPLLGRSIVHKEGVELLRQWINTLTPCN